MPELPEVETIVVELKSKIVGSVINEVKLSTNKMRFPANKNFAAQLLHRSIIALRRRAKYILIDLDDQNSIIIHLGMSGRLMLYDDMPQNIKHHHLTIFLSSGQILTLYDPRRFGFYGLLSDYQFLLDRSGIEPLSGDFNQYILSSIISRTSRIIKDVLMDAAKISGIGNIYASEILFLSQINPLRISNTLSMTECDKLVANTKYVLQKAIDHGGSTLKDYRKSNGEVGNFQNHFLVYGKSNRPCPKCQSAIQKVIIKNRASYYSEICQR